MYLFDPFHFNLQYCSTFKTSLQSALTMECNNKNHQTYGEYKTQSRKQLQFKKYVGTQHQEKEVLYSCLLSQAAGMKKKQTKKNLPPL